MEDRRESFPDHNDSILCTPMAHLPSWVLGLGSSIFHRLSMHSLVDLLHVLRDPSALITAVGMVGIPIIIFIETGLLFPMLPGDSLLVTAGLLASQPDGPVKLNVWVLAVSCSLAAILGSFGARTWSGRTSSTSGTAAGRSSWRSSCRSSARSLRSSPAPPR